MDRRTSIQTKIQKSLQFYQLLKFLNNKKLLILVSELNNSSNQNLNYWIRMMELTAFTLNSWTKQYILWIWISIFRHERRKNKKSWLSFLVLVFLSRFWKHLILGIRTRLSFLAIVLPIRFWRYQIVGIRTWLIW